MKHILLSFILLLASVSAAYCQLSASSGAIEISYPEVSISKVYLFNTLSGATLTYTGSNPSVTFYKYSTNLQNKTIVPASDISGNTIINLEDGRGYTTSANESEIYWVIDYSQHTSQIKAVKPRESGDEGEKCAKMYLDLEVEETPLQYYTSTGEVKYIQRKYTVTYDNLRYNDDNLAFDDIEEKVEDLTPPLKLSSPLKDTKFTVSDQYASQLNMQNGMTSETYTATRVEAYMYQKEIIDGFEPDSITVTFSPSAPLTAKFFGVTNEPTADHLVWYIYFNGDKDNYELMRQGDRDMTYTFTKAGKYEIVFQVNNLSSGCAATASYENLTISESALDIPNFFSPDGSPGINDEFKVKHKSLIKFKATIFNRWGNKLFEWDDPDKGWDGKYKGKFVSPGVYFYIIEATGSDGIKYKKGGDINILRGK
ncbi:MAG: gliding motility-associated C-terminal domain-containing protein [Dysgonomonas sp.]